MTDRRPILIGGVPFTVSDLHTACQRVIQHAIDADAVAIRLANAYCVALASKDARYRNLLTNSGVNFPDGAPVAWLMQRNSRGAEKPMQIRGPSLFEDVLDKGRASELRHYFLGSTDQTLDLLSNEVRKQFPGVIIAGSYSPPYSPLDDNFYQKCVAHISSANAQVIWVALGTPKQDFAAQQITQLTGLPTVAVGAAFDFLAGTAKQAPKWMQGSGLEWSYRLATEPRRLWKRYIFGNLTFINAVIRPNLYEGKNG